MPAHAAPLALHQELVAAVREHHCRKALICRLLDQMDQASGLREFAATFDEYAEHHLNMSPREASELRRVGGSLRHLPKLRQAFETGEVGWCKMREIVRVATPATEQAWLSAAARDTTRDIERLVARTAKGDEPPHPDDDSTPPVAKQVRLTIEGEASEIMLIRKLITVRRHAMGEDAPARCDDAVILADVARTMLAHASKDAGDQAPRDAFQVNVMRCPSCDTTTHVGHATHLAVSPEVAEELACCAVEVDLTPGPDQGKVSDEVPARTQRFVRGRAKFKCEIPGCEHSAWTHIHHVVPRNQGGSHDPDNLMVCCSGHHRRIHKGHLRAWRNDHGGVDVERVPEEAWPDSFHWQLLMDVLRSHALHADQAAPVLGASAARTRQVLKHLEQRGLVVQATSGEWFAQPEIRWPDAHPA